MKSLQQYIYESIDNDVNEGKIIDVIKNWFKSLFEPSDKKFNRFDEEHDLKGSNLSNYIDYLKENFEINKIKVNKIEDKKYLKDIVYPNGVEPNYEQQLGFYDFIDNVNNEKDKTQYLGLFFEDSECTDVPALINYKKEEEAINIIKIQIIKEFIDFISLNQLIDLIKTEKEFIEDSKTLFIKKDTNKELYNKLINDCNFKEEYDKSNNENIAKLSLEE